MKTIYEVWLPTCPEGEFGESFDNREDAESYAKPRSGIIIESEEGG